MPGALVGPINGIQDRSKGKGIVSSAWLQQVGKGTAVAAGGGNISCQLSAAGAGNGNDTTEDTLFSAILPANTFDLFGRNLWIQAWGNITATSATKTIRVYFGATIVYAGIVATTTQTGNWQANLDVFRIAANQQIALAQGDFVGGTTVRSVQVFNAGAENDSAAITIKVTGQTSVAGANVLTCNGLVIAGYN